MLSEFITCQFGTLHVFPLLVYLGLQLVSVRDKSGVTPYKTLQNVDDYSYSQFNFIILDPSTTVRVKTTRGVFPPLPESQVASTRSAIFL